MSAHPTPGPWRVAPVTTRAGRHIVAIDSPSRSICNISTAGRNGEDAEQVANARLIAAAPDMMQALEAILDVGLSEQTHALACKALAKARDQGETGQ